jgi:GH24 family phage-related lysozyme (muramidase)
MDVISWIKKCEGFSSKPYKDKFQNFKIGYGINLDHGLSEKQCDFLMKCEILNCIDELNHYSWYTIQSQNRKDALLNMCYNLKIYGLLTFKKMISYLEKKDYANAAKEILNSQWAINYNERAKDVAVMIREGK